MHNPIITLILGLVIGLGVAAGTFFWGTSVGQAAAQNQQQAFLQARGIAGTGAAGASGFPGGAGAPGGFPGAPGAGGRGGTIGTISKVDGSTLTLTVPGSADIQVTLSTSTTIQQQAQGTVTDLKEGQRVLVRGTQSGHNIAATAVQVTDGLGLGGPSPSTPLTPAP